MVGIVIMYVSIVAVVNGIVGSVVIIVVVVHAVVKHVKILWWMYWEQERIWLWKQLVYIKAVWCL